MTKVLFLFVDGVGLGSNDPDRNPLVRAEMPAMRTLLDGLPLTGETTPFENELATLVEVDARMGVSGAPQSATGQAALLTGVNVPEQIGRHYGPKPNPEIAAVIEDSNVFLEITQRGGTAALLNAYPPQYFEGIDSGRRLFSAIPLAAHAAGQKLMSADDLQGGRALSVDFTGAGWAARSEFPSAPIYEPRQAGAHLAGLSGEYDFTWFDFWLSDYAGHKGEMAQAVELLEGFDQVFAGLIDAWALRDDLFVLTSDHGNLEDLSVRGHTDNPVPALLLGPLEKRRRFASGLSDLTDFAPAIMKTIFPHTVSPAHADAASVDDG